jgi:hypothetical protein
MTKTMLKAIWFGGGGVIATWLAITPNQHAPGGAPTAEAQPAGTISTLNADDVRAQADRLKTRRSAEALRTPTRNPFRFGTPKPSTPKREPEPKAPMPMLVPAPATPLAPMLKLDGIAAKTTSGGLSRTAVISSEGQIYVVREGDAVAGRYTVVAIDPEAVLLRDTAGVELRLALPPR